MEKRSNRLQPHYNKFSKQDKMLLMKSMNILLKQHLDIMH